MDLLAQTKYLIKKIGLKPNKLKGQNFCIDEAVIKEMVRVAQVSKQDTVLEVGAGFGFLTAELLKSARKVLAVELDKKLIAVLKNLGVVHQNLEVIREDILSFQISDSGTIKVPQPSGSVSFVTQQTSLYGSPYKIVANLPYSITSAFLKKFLTTPPLPQSMTLLVQKEVAERICAGPGQMSLLAVSVQLYSQPKIIRIISKESFWPQPKIDSAILQINNIINFPFKDQVSEKKFWQIIRSGFCARRKQLKNNLSNSLQLSAAAVVKIFNKVGINPQSRAQELALENWLKLAKEIKI